MTETIKKLEQLLTKGHDYISQSSEEDLRFKANPEKWSKKEILGHLIDSAINNLPRFTEVQFEERPYKIRGYKQNDLVRVNNYQNSSTKELLDLWVSINTRIKFLIAQQSPESLAFQIQSYDDSLTDLGFLMKDYVDHIEHHINQIIE